MSSDVRHPTERELRESVEELLGLLTDYYWHVDDPELAAVNRLRRMVGWREQLPEHLEVELQADEVEKIRASGRSQNRTGWHGLSDASSDERGGWQA